ncbi:cation diffusion facilitator family transporter [Arthrobacter bambusae]|uniref:cation diffusion facilitator family transporter n=1 Tax=Arthrobacter bambusae TaxID=1338426 RepID=UPI00277EC979|nr:cation diffusion facilitator family transporter [Arthrobacter bambusae]MDQ0212075.1 cobalt-zinc-cadmium efflux system protein [Arthrobacter bambusae]MDQ0236740.1 cobalt-zinc-cadmium efflux system protein [Arthrobacter bambusae]
MTRTRRLSVVLILNLVLVAGLLVVGISANSLGVLAEGVDYLADAAAIGVSLLAVRVSKLPPTPTRPHGYQMATTWAAGVNAGWLLVLSVAILAGAAGRLITGTSEVHGLPVLIVSGIAAVVMFVGALILGGDDGDDGDDRGNKAGGDLNMRAVLLDTAGDAAAAAGVALAGAVIYVTQGLYWLDPVVAAIIALVVGYHAVRLLIEIFEALRAHRRSGSRP